MKDERSEEKFWFTDPAHQTVARLGRLQVHNFMQSLEESKMTLIGGYRYKRKVRIQKVIDVLQNGNPDGSIQRSQGPAYLGPYVRINWLGQPKQVRNAVGLYSKEESPSVAPVELAVAPESIEV